MINIVKIQGDSFLVDSNKSVPNDPRNTDYQAVQEWIAEGNIPEPEFTQTELDEQAETQRIESIKSEGLARIQVEFASAKDIDDFEVHSNVLIAANPSARAAPSKINRVLDVFDTVNESILAGTALNDVVWP